MDKKYWQKFYENHLKAQKQSLFAEFVWENYLANLKKNLRQSAATCHVERSETFLLSKTSTQNSRQSAATPSLQSQSVKNSHKVAPFRLIELGCGNGRDSLYFAKCDLSVLGVDQCENVVEFLNAHFKSENLRFLSGDFTALADFEERFDAVYSRFTLHSITQTQQDRLFAWIVRNLKSGGVLAIEARGLKNSLFQKGEAVPNEPNAFIYENHYRRFVDMAALCEALKGLNFSLNFAKEEQNFAPFKDENDYFFRIVAVANERERERETALRANTHQIKLWWIFIANFHQNPKTNLRANSNAKFITNSRTKFTTIFYAKFTANSQAKFYPSLNTRNFHAEFYNAA